VHHRENDANPSVAEAIQSHKLTRILPNEEVVTLKWISIQQRRSTMQAFNKAAKWLAQRVLDAFLRELFRFALERFKDLIGH